jgi:hypothetical protein
VHGLPTCIPDKPTALASPWQNGFAERLIGSIRRECLDHLVGLGETHLRRILRFYARYCNDIRAHMAPPGGHRPRRNRGRLLNIDLVNKLAADSRAAGPHRN